MKSIIIGAGKVGYNIAAMLCRAGHEVTVIDNNRARLDSLEEYLDINTVEGNAARVSTLHQADVRHTDLLVALTDKDELNMIACFVAKSEGAGRTVARVSDPDYSDFNNVERMKALGIDMLINPELVTAIEIGKLINFPEANYVGYFGDGAVLIQELMLPPDYPHKGMPLAELAFPYPCIIIG
ncbi:MAG: NAD-binding protein, partial [Clostridiales bacterium]|nr:NAD-binding protein [Clostridiales bacterium]